MGTSITPLKDRALKYRLVSFDLDGTLVDTAAEIAESVHLTFDDFALVRRPQDEITLLIGKGTHELMSRLMQRLYAEQPGLQERLPFETVFAQFDHHYAVTAGQLGRPYPGCEDALERLRSAGVQLACVTNKEQRHAERVLAATGLARWFPTLIGGDTLPYKKPDPRVISGLLQGCGVTAAQAAHLGDSSIDVQTARSAGVAAWAVPYGYNAGVPIEQSTPDRLFASLPAVADWALAGDSTAAG
jgi:phosphoglycolate phosphatase